MAKGDTGFFLPSGGESADTPFPPRSGCRVTPLILAADMYPALEQAILDARELVLLAFRIFDPDTRTRSRAAQDRGLADWAALLRDAVQRGLTVRVLLTDFEPTVAHDLHSLSWGSFRRLRAIAQTLSADERERFEIIVSQHPGEMGWLTRQLLRIPIGFVARRAVGAITGHGDGAKQAMETRPGLWRYHRRRMFPDAPRLWPATHHHKFAVIDDRIAIVGGIDINERRWETRRYSQPADESWHDISARVDGPAARDAAIHFRRLWNAALPDFVATTRFWLKGIERDLAIDPLDPMPGSPAAVDPLPDGASTVQMLRTLSVRSPRPHATGPRPHIRELMHGARRTIQSAERLLYIEAQFFRHKRTARWIWAQARRKPGLHVIILLPQAPDDVAFYGKGENPAHRHGEWLQSRSLLWLKRRLGDRLGLFSLARKAPLSEREKQFAADRGAAFGAGIIYIHSKLILADDRRAMISSANINGRSFNWDSELGFLWEDAESVGAMRRRLWGQLMERGAADVPGMADGLSEWRA